MTKLRFLAITILLSLCLAPLASANQLSKLFEKASPSVVILHTFERVPKINPATKERMTSVEGLGSGVVISKDGLILTAAHVVQVTDSVHVQFKNGEKILGKVVASEPTADVALVKLEKLPNDLTVAAIADSGQVKVGDDIFVIGAPYGIGHSITAGYISGRRKPPEKSMFSDVEFFQTDAAVNMGNSGGPMFNMKGEVIGIVSHILSQSGGFEGMGFAVTSNSAKQLLLEEKRIWSGIDGQLLTDELAGIFQLPQTAGALVQRVAEGSFAQNAGIKGGDVPANIGGIELLLGGDILLNIENVPIKDEDSIKLIKKTIGRKKPGEEVRITLLRKGRILKIKGKMP
ncbi:S1C family serine protease [Kaarinaea lacus]